MKNLCIDCNKEINVRSIRCKLCSNIINSRKPRKKNKIIPYCLDCGIKLSKNKYKRCKKCADKEKRGIKILYCCVDCGNKISLNSALYGNGRCMKCAHKKEKHNRTGTVHTEETKKRISLATRYENNPRWIDGRSFELYPKEFNNELKEKIRKRDNYTCQNCNITEEEHIIVFGEVLTIHHINYNKKDCAEENLITVCRNCNVRANSNISYWINYYNEKIGALYDY